MARRSILHLSILLKSLRKKVRLAAVAGLASFRLAVFAARTGIRRLGESVGRRIHAAASGAPYYRHSLPVRIMHWGNAVFLAILLMSGLNIFNAHPALYWGLSSYQGAPPFFALPGGFPSWLTLPGERWLAMGRRWHLFFAWLLVVNGLVFMIYGVAGRHVQRDLLPTRQDWRSIGKSIRDHLHFRHPAGEASKSYNVLQKLTYLGVIFFLLPLMVLMGLGMSPALDAVLPGWVDIFAGRQSIRTIHFAIAWLLVLFVIVHVFEVIVTGFWNNVRSMVTGYYRVKPEGDHEK